MCMIPCWISAHFTVGSKTFCMTVSVLPHPQEAILTAMPFQDGMAAYRRGDYATAIDFGALLPTKATPPLKVISGLCITAAGVSRRTIARPRRLGTSSPADQGNADRSIQSRGHVRAAAMVAPAGRCCGGKLRICKLQPTKATPALNSISGYFYENGRGVCRRTIARLQRLLQARRRPGRRVAHKQSRVLLRQGRGGLPKDESARPRASTSSPPTRAALRAPINLAYFYYQGHGGLPKDDREAARLYKLAADQGNPDGQAQSRGLLRAWPWRPAEGRPRGRAPLQARR